MRAYMLTLALSFGLPACGNESGTSDPIDPYSTTGGVGPGAGGSPTGGTPLAAGGLSAGGTPTSTGGSAATLGECFSHDAGFDTCNIYCRSKGLECAARSCGPDGRPSDPMNGVTTVSYPAARKAECGVQLTTQYGWDECITPIWLSPTKPLDDVVRCCCR
jgi:hypothetical protein